MPVSEDGFRLPTIQQDSSKAKIEVVPGPNQSEHNQTFIVQDEDDTLGNAIKHILSQDESVKICGYVVPHPMERIIQINISTNEGVDATNVLKDALLKLKKQNIEIKKRIQSEVREYKKLHPELLE